MAGVKINPECVTEFNSYKMGRSEHGYLVLALSCDMKEVVVERKGAAGVTWDEMVKTLPSNEPRYVIMTFHWDMGPIDGKRSRTVFVHWCPETTIKQRMVYAATKQGLKQALTGLQIDIHASSACDLRADRALELCQRFNKA